MFFKYLPFFFISSCLVKALPHGNNNNSSLQWAPCDLPFPPSVSELITAPIDCATLEVPLDYTNQASSRTLTLTLVKHNATKAPFKGTVIMNPGGPGASGVEEIATKGATYRDLIFGGQFNVIGFDARGSGKTIPFACDLASLWNTTSPINATDPSIISQPYNGTLLPQLDTYSLLQGKAWSDGRQFAEACVKGNEGIGRFIGTAFVARDMLRIVDALNEDGKLRFWGRSYSTLLGQTFAAMFPNRVGRMLLDSNIVPHDYWSGNWLTATSDTESALTNVLDECVVAGPTICPIANFTGNGNTTTSSLLSALSSSFQSLLDNPIYLTSSYTNYLPWWRPGNLPLLHELKYRIYQYLYYPSQFSIVTGVIASILARDWESWINAPAPPTLPAPWSEGRQAFHGVACSDSSFRASSPSDMYNLVRAQSVLGSFADAFSTQTWICAHWPFKAAERFEADIRDINTSFPLLYINSPYDPITPLKHAWEAAHGFKNSRVLVHKGHGHGFMNHPSSCSIEAVRKYFVDGELPPHGLECQPDLTGFEYLAEIEKAVGGNRTGTGVVKRGLNMADFGGWW